MDELRVSLLLHSSSSSSSSARCFLATRGRAQARFTHRHRGYCGCEETLVPFAPRLLLLLLLRSRPSIRSCRRSGEEEEEEEKEEEEEDDLVF